MRAVLRALKATYTFFAGDAIILIAVVIAFAAAFTLARVLESHALAVVAFMVFIVGGLTATLARERAGRQ